jgi:ABC-2 type transport system ATP-binding protein
MSTIVIINSPLRRLPYPAGSTGDTRSDDDRPRRLDTVVAMTRSDATIVVDELARTFGTVHALAGVTFSVAPGSILGLLGPNGSGKTTTVRILTTILLPDRGAARVLGLDVVRQPDAVREVIGLAGQYAAVDENLTGKENLRLVGMLTHLPRRAIGPRADELLERFSLSDAADRPVRTYSGGMRRRLDLAAALVHRPPVVFLDEPSTGLDPRTRNELWAIIGELVAEGTTVLLTTQYLEEADRLADEIVVLDHGRVIAAGTSAELKAGLGNTIVAVTMPDAGSAVRASHLLAQVGATSVAADGRTVEVNVAQGGRDVLAVARTLDGEGLCPEQVAMREPTLDDVFLSITGHVAHETADANEAGAA